MGKYRKTGKMKACKYCGTLFKSYRNVQYCSKKCAALWKSLYGFHYVPVTPISDTLCWNCGKALADSDCPWANNFIPVEGWEATSTNVNMGNNRTQKSYVVHKCPIFERG